MASENQEAPNRVADAARLLERFVGGEGYIVDGTTRVADDVRTSFDWATSDDRAAVIAAQLLAVASATERIAIALESLMAVCAVGGERRAL